MGAVYEVEHALIGRRMALKCLHPEYARDRDLVERFRREARAASVIGNEHIVAVTDMGDLPDGAPFLVMELLKGQGLSELLKRQGPLTVGRTCTIARQICVALQAAHDKGIVHRDMKPANVFLEARSAGGDFVKVLDFGISKMQQPGTDDRGLTRTGVAMGTPSYMSPEQAQGAKDVDHRTDVWALGVMLYEMLALRRPFEADSYPLMLMAIVALEPEPVTAHRGDVPPELDALILRALAKPVEQRIQTMAQLADALRPFVGIDSPPRFVASAAEEPAVREASTRAPRAKRGPDSARPAAELAQTVSAPPSAGPGRPASPASSPEPAPAELPAGPGAPARSGGQATGEMGLVPASEPARGTDRAPGTSSVLLRGSLALGAVSALAVGGWAAFAGERTPPAAVAPIAAPSPSAPSPPDVAPPSVEAPGAEVLLQITTEPADARVEIGGVSFPNPLTAHRPRSLDPVTIRVSAPGHETVERLVVLDRDQSFVFQLARGPGGPREGRGEREARAREAPSGSPGRVGEGTPPVAGDEGFRDEF